jgi:hypothetical protein
VRVIVGGSAGGVLGGVDGGEVGVVLAESGCASGRAGSSPSSAHAPAAISTASTSTQQVLHRAEGLMSGSTLVQLVQRPAPLLEKVRQLPPLAVAQPGDQSVLVGDVLLDQVVHEPEALLRQRDPA